MRYEITLPPSAPVQGRATVGRWRKEIGDSIRKGEVVLAVETRTTVLEIESEFEGMLADIFLETGTEAKPGVVLGIIEDESPEPQAAPATEAAETEDEEPAEESAATAEAGLSAAAAKVSARARWLAEASGLDISGLRGSGPGGRIIVGDVEAAIARKKTEELPPKPEPAEAVAPAAPTRQMMLTPAEQVWVQRMAQAHRDIPQYNITMAVDATALVAWRAARKDAPSITAIMAKLAAEALMEHPRLFGTFLGRSWRENAQVNMAVAVDTPRGMMWPVLHDVKNRPLDQLVLNVATLAQRARDGALTQHDLTDANFSLTNLGMFGVESFNGLIMPGLSAVLAVGAIQQEPRVVNSVMKTRHMVRLTLGCDRRIIEGTAGARFLARLKELVEKADL
ncbi:MAG: 2-oxo acid dehydrogenase subunit E2 [Verrucomicrobia bacterium]|nr:2-oxo acid dehydrogenase subunit E2 [Verrucomicrobiota bacterium]